MKRTLLATVTALALTASLAACGSGSSSSAASDSPTATVSAEASASATDAGTQGSASDTSAADAVESTPIAMDSIASYETPEGFTASTDEEGTVTLTGTDSSGNLVVIALSAEQGDWTDEATVAYLRATASEYAASSTDEVTAEGSEVTIDGERGPAYATSTSSGDIHLATHLAYVTHNGSLLAVSYAATNLNGSPVEGSEAAFNEFLGTITWK